MTYKDKDKQKLSTKQRVQKYRALHQRALQPLGVTELSQRGKVSPLPVSILDQIKRTVKARLELGLENDFEDRVQRATDYHNTVTLPRQERLKQESIKRVGIL